MVAIDVLITYAAILVLCIAWKEREAQQFALSSWEELTGRLYAVRTEGILKLGREPRATALWNTASTRTCFASIGGREGLSRMLHNARIMVRIASCDDYFHNGSDLSVAEQLRDDNLRLKRDVFLLNILLSLHYFGPHTMSCMTRVAFTYAHAVEALLSLHHGFSTKRKARLVAACNW